MAEPSQTFHKFLLANPLHQTCLHAASLAEGYQDEEEKLQQALDEFGDFFDVDRTADEVHFLAVAVDEHTGRETAIETEFACALPAAKQDGEIDLRRGTANGKRLVADVGAHRFLAFVIHGESHHRESRRFKSPLQADEIRHFVAAARAPRG